MFADIFLFSFLQSTVDTHLAKMKYDSIAKNVSSMLDHLSADQRADLINRLR
jgi:hypothetical protein